SPRPRSRRRSGGAPFEPLRPRGTGELDGMGVVPGSTHMCAAAPSYAALEQRMAWFSRLAPSREERTMRKVGEFLLTAVVLLVSVARASAHGPGLRRAPFWPLCAPLLLPVAVAATVTAGVATVATGVATAITAPFTYPYALVD